MIYDELVRAIASNRELESLNLEFEDVFQDSYHDGLRKSKINIEEDEADYEYSWLQPLLARNRRMEVRGKWMDLVMSRRETEELYSFHRLNVGSELLRALTHCIRTSLIATALTEKACRDFRRSALLMASYTDRLCEFLRTTNRNTSDLRAGAHRRKKVSFRIFRRDLSSEMEKDVADWSANRAHHSSKQSDAVVLDMKRRKISKI
jgi:hypothetical protein